MKKIECPGCAMEVDSRNKECPICGTKLEQFSPAIRWVALGLVLIFLMLLFSRWF